MAKPQALILRSAGTNCDNETAFGLEQAGFAAHRQHVLALSERPDDLKDYQLLVVAGGFSYGDDVSAGKILANQLLHRLGEALNRFIEADKLVLGICNGFQVLLKSGLLPGGRADAAAAGREATLGWNDSGRFEDRWVHVRVDTDRCAFLSEGDVLAMPVAHGEGKFVCDREQTLSALRHAGQIALRYVGADGQSGEFPINPNGSDDDVAGVCDPTGRVLGLMPHPERFCRIEQHPRWTRQQLTRADGAELFRNAFAYLQTS